MNEPKGSKLSNNDVLYYGAMQDRTLDALKGISKSLEETAKNLKSLQTGYDKMNQTMDSMIHDLKQGSHKSHNQNPLQGADKSSQAFKDGQKESAAQSRLLAKAIVDQEKDRQKTLGKLQQIMNQFVDKDTGEALTADQARAYLDLQEQAADRQRQVVDYIEKKVISIFSYLGNVANKWSNTTNAMIQSSGMNGDSVREVRHEFANMIGDLNTQTGFAYNASEAYQTMANLSQQVTGNLEAIQEMSRPMMLADKSIPGDLSNIATTFNRLYTRYNFTSQNMEDALNGILSNTAGSSATQEDIMQAFGSMDTLIRYAADGDTEMYQKMFSETGSYVNELKDAGLDVQTYTDILNKVFYDEDMDEISRLLSLSGTGIDYQRLKELIINGDLNTAIDAVMKGYAGAAGVVLDDGSNTTGDMLGLGTLVSNKDAAIQAWEYLKNGSMNAPEDITANMVDNVEDLYVSAQDKIINALSPAGENLATIQEKIGVGFSDVSIALNFIIGILMASAFLGGGSGGGSTLRNMVTNLKNIGGKASTGAGNLISKAGTVISKAGVGNVLGAAGGIALGIDGISGAMDETKGTTSRVASGVEGVAGFGAAAGLGTAAVAGALGAAGVATAATPIGWALLGAAGIAKLVSVVADQMDHSSAAVAATEEAFKNAQKSLNKEARSRESSLKDIRTALASSQDLEEQRNALINTGLLSEQDRAALEANWSTDVESNRTALKTLTEAYLQASVKLNMESNVAITKYKNQDKVAVEKFNSLLGGSNGKLMMGTLSEDTQMMLLSAAQSNLEEAVASGNATDEQKKALEDLEKNMWSDGKFTPEKLDLGLITKSGAITADTLADSYLKESILNDWKGTSIEGSDMYNLVQGLYGSTNAANVLSQFENFKLGSHDMAEAEEFLGGIIDANGELYKDEVTALADNYGIDVDELYSNHLSTNSGSYGKEGVTLLDVNDYEDTEGKKTNETLLATNKLLGDIRTKINKASNTGSRSSSSSSSSSVGSFLLGLSPAGNILNTLNSTGVLG